MRGPSGLRKFSSVQFHAGGGTRARRGLASHRHVYRKHMNILARVSGYIMTLSEVSRSLSELMVTIRVRRYMVCAYRIWSVQRKAVHEQLGVQRGYSRFSCVSKRGPRGRASWMCTDHELGCKDAVVRAACTGGGVGLDLNGLLRSARSLGSHHSFHLLPHNQSEPGRTRPVLRH